MSRGAEHCGVSQSAASQHVQEVERRLGVTLLDRSKRPLELTQAGRIYSEFCRDVLRREEEFSMSLESLKGDVEGTVRVASIYSVGPERNEPPAASSSPRSIPPRNCTSSTCGPTKSTMPCATMRPTSAW